MPRIITQPLTFGRESNSAVYYSFHLSFCVKTLCTKRYGYRNLSRFLLSFLFLSSPSTSFLSSYLTYKTWQRSSTIPQTTPIIQTPSSTLSFYFKYQNSDSSPTRRTDVTIPRQRDNFWQSNCSSWREDFGIQEGILGNWEGQGLSYVFSLPIKTSYSFPFLFYLIIFPFRVPLPTHGQGTRNCFLGARLAHDAGLVTQSSSLMVVGDERVYSSHMFPGSLACVLQPREGYEHFHFNPVYFF